MPLPLSGKFLIADVVEIQKKSVITYATFSLITITRKLRRNYGCRNYGFHYARTLSNLDELSRELCEMCVCALCGGQRGGSGSPLVVGITT